MNVFLIDGTYELFRYHFGQPSHRTADGREVGATRGVVSSMVSMLESGATHIGIATDHTVESFRNAMYEGYKTSEGMDAELLAQFPLIEDALRSLGLVVWPMVEYEADDALASASDQAMQDARVEQVIVCSPDKDLAQCVVGDRVIQRNRRTGIDSLEQDVHLQFGVGPKSIPDFLALVGDSADGFPGIKGWGKKSAAVVLGSYLHLESIPRYATDWDPSIRAGVRGSEVLSQRLASEMADALLFRDLATLRRDVPVFHNVDELCWQGPRNDFAATCAYVGASRLVERITRLCPNA
jgi:5'-3' exonuclease